MDPATMYGIGVGLEALGGIFGGGGNRRLSRYEANLASKRDVYKGKAFDKIRAMEPKMTGPVDYSQIAKMAPLISKAVAPYIRGVATRAGARLGVRSPMTTGKVTSAATQALAGPMAELYSGAVHDKWRKMSQVYAGWHNLASA